MGIMGLSSLFQRKWTTTAIPSIMTPDISWVSPETSVSSLRMSPPCLRHGTLSQHRAPEVLHVDGVARAHRVTVHQNVHLLAMLQGPFPDALRNADQCSPLVFNWWMSVFELLFGGTRPDQPRFSSPGFKRDVELEYKMAQL